MFVALCVWVLAGCTAAISPAQLADDVDVFAAGVLQATTTYREQRDFYVAYRNDQELAALRQAVRDPGPGNPSPRLLIGPNTGAACKNAVTELAKKAARVETVAVSDGAPPQPVPVGISDDDFAKGRSGVASACDLRISVGGTDKPLRLSRPNPSPLHDRLAAGLESYVTGLRNLVGTADRAEFDQAAAAASEQFREFFASTQDIAVKLSEGDTPPLQIDKELGVIGDALAKAVAATLEAKRRQELARIVQASGNVVATAAGKLAAISRHYHIAAAQDLAEDYRLAVQAANLAIRRRDADFNARIDMAAAAEQRMVSYMELDPAAAFVAMVQAHEALDDKVRNPEADVGALAGDIQDFFQTSTSTLEALRSVQRKARARGNEEDQP